MFVKMLKSKFLQLYGLVLHPPSKVTKVCYSSKCREGCYSARKSKYFDIKNVILERSRPRDCKAIKCFLNLHYWPSEPTISSLFLPLNSPYLKLLSHKYATTGSCVMALENVGSPRNRLIGLTVCSIIDSRWSRELDCWAQATTCKSSKSRLLFHSHAIRDSNIFEKYNVNTMLEVEVLSVAQDWRGRGLGRMLMRNALEDACQLRYPLVMTVCTNKYAAKICEKLNMKKEWSIKYEDYVDEMGNRLFHPRLPHAEAIIYTKKLEDCYF